MERPEALLDTSRRVTALIPQVDLPLDDLGDKFSSKALPVILQAFSTGEHLEANGTESYHLTPSGTSEFSHGYRFFFLPLSRGV